MIDTPVASSPAMMARSIGAAPRHRGSSDGWTLSIGYSESNGSRMSAPNAQTQTTSGRAAAIWARAASSLTDAGWASSRPSSAATCATGGAARRRPRPAGRSGRVTTRAGRCAVAASARRTAAANSEVPRKTVRTQPVSSGGLLGVAEDAHRLLALFARGTVEDEHPVEVIHLVLDDPGLEARGLDEHGRAVLVLGPDTHVDRTLHVEQHGRKAEAALLHRLGLLARPFDLRIDQSAHRRLLLDPVDQHP